MNPLINNNLYLVKLIGENTYVVECEADEMVKEKITEGFMVSKEQEWYEYFNIWHVKWYKIIK